MPANPSPLRPLRNSPGGIRGGKLAERPPFCILHSSFCVRSGAPLGVFARPFCILPSTFYLRLQVALGWL